MGITVNDCPKDTITTISKGKLNNDASYHIYAADKAINTISYDDRKFKIHDNNTDELRNKISELEKNINRQLNITMLHSCRSCGAKLDCDINKPVFHCKYCGSTYIIGNVQQNSTY